MPIRWSLGALALAVAAAPLDAQQVVQLGAADKALDWKTADVFVVGDDEAREEEQLARIAATAFDAQDNLYVLDSDNGRVSVFDRTGRFVRQFGRKGEGPGELRFPGLMTVTTDGHVVVLDRGNRALVVYRRDGTYVRNVPIDGSLGIGGRYLAAHPKGGVVFAVNPGVQVVNGRAQMDTSGVRVFWQQSFAEGAKPVLLHTTQEPVAPEQPRVESSGGRTMVMVRQAPPAFTPQLHFGLLGEGTLVVSRVPAYELDVVGQPGAVARRLARPFQPRKVTEADKATERKRRLEALRTGGGPQIMISGSGPGGRAPQVNMEEMRRRMEEDIENLQFAETIPVVQGVLGDPAGRLWILRAPPAPGRPAVIDVVGADGRYLGTVSGTELPSSVSPGGLAAFTSINEYDVPVVVVRRIGPR